MKTMYSNIRRVLARAILAAAFLSASAVTHAQATTKFDLPAQSLADSLRAVASQTHSNILFDRSLVAGLSAKALAAQLSVDDALKRLLAGTGLTYRKADEKTVVIVPVRTSESSLGSVPPLSDGGGGRSVAGEGREAGDLPGLAENADASRKRNAIPISSGNSADAAMGEIVVTARRHEESLQQVPMAISAFDQDTLQRQGVSTLTDLQQLVPSAYVTSYAHGSSQQFFTLRGQGETGQNTGGGAGGGPAVVGYLSEVPVPMSGPGLYYDLQSVQVLKGPQGTLFGRNTTGGAILFEPRRPSLETFEGDGQLLAGDYARGEAQGAINIPVIDGELAVRIAGQLASREGYTRDVNTGVEYDNRHFQAARIGILFQPTNAIENYFIGNYLAFNEHGPGTSVIAGNPNNPFIGTGILDYVTAQEARGTRRTALSVSELDQGVFYNLINKTSVTLGEDLTLRNIVSYSRQQIRRQDDEDGTRLALLDSVGSAPGAWLVDQGTLTEELQLQGNSFAKTLNWQTGLYYESDNTPDPSNRNYSQQVALLPFYSNSQDIDYSGTSFGMYGQGSYKLAWLLDGLSFTAGYRYTWDHLREGYSQSFDATRTPQAGDACTSRAGAAYPNCSISAAANHQGSSYTVGFDYQWDPTILLYLVSRQGYKSGGFNIVAVTVGDPSSSAFSFRPETVRDVEIGAKIDWSLGNVKGRTNIAAYHSWYRDAQVNTSDLIDNLQESVTENAARATIEGVEIENTLQPTRFTELTLTYSYMDAYYNRYITPLGQNLTNLPYANAPRHKGSAAARVRLPLPGSAGAVWMGASFTYQDRVFAGFSSVDPGSFIPPYGLVGLRADWERMFGSRLDASLFVTNVGNKTYRVANEDLYSTIGTATTVYGEPRMWGVSLRYRF